MKAATTKHIYSLLYGGLLFACAFPGMNMFYDRWNTPKRLCTLFVAGLIAIFTAIYLATRKKEKGYGHFELWSEAVAGVAALECLYALFALCRYPATWQLGITGTFDNPAGLAFFLCASLPFSFALLSVYKTDKGRKAFYTAVCLLIAATIPLTHSRTGLICLAAYILTAIAHYGKPHMRIRWKLAIPVVALTGASVLFFKSGSTSGRMFILGRTWELIRENPWTGYGTGGFNKEYMNKQADFFKQHPDSPAAMLADETGHPLNEFAYLWVEHGIAAPLALLLLPAGLCYILRHRKDMPSLTASCTLIPLLLFSLFSYPFRYPMAWVTVGWCAGIAAENRLRVLLRRKVLKSLAILGLFSAGIGMETYLVRELPWEKDWGHASREALKGKGKKMMPEYARLYTHYAHHPEFLYNYAAELFQTGYPEEALHMALACRKLWSKYNLELLTGDICRELRKYEEAIRHYKSAAYMCPVRFAPLEGLYYAYKNTGDFSRADSIALTIQQKDIKVPSYDVERIKKEIRPEKQHILQNTP